MAAGSRNKTTIAKLARERALRERRELKQAKKAARRQRVAPQVDLAATAEAGQGADAAQPDLHAGGS